MLFTDHGYRLPPKEIQEIVDVPPNPSYYISPRRDRIMFLKRRAMTPLSELAKPDKSLLVYGSIQVLTQGVECK